MSQLPGWPWSDEPVHGAKRALLAGDARPALALLAQARGDGHRRAHYVGVLSRPGGGGFPASRGLMNLDPDNPDVCLLLGAGLSPVARGARGAGTLDKNSPDQLPGPPSHPGPAPPGPPPPP